MRYDEKSGNFIEVPINHISRKRLSQRMKIALISSILAISTVLIVWAIFANRPPGSGPLGPRDFRYIVGNNYTYNSGEGKLLPAKVECSGNGDFVLYVYGNAGQQKYFFSLDKNGNTTSKDLGNGKAEYDAEIQSVYITLGCHSLMK